MTDAADRYARQVVLPEIGMEGQEALRRSRALIVGVGALGTYQASFLARAGVGHITLVDRDVVELNNLQRQVLFEEQDLDHPKALAARVHLLRANSSIEVEAKPLDFNFSNAEGLVAPADVVLDGTDNMETRYLVNDACVKLGKPWVYGGAVGTSGMVMSIVPGGPCLRCAFPDAPGPGDLPSCDTAGVLNTLPAVAAGLQVTESLKILMGRPPAQGLITFDLWSREISVVAVGKDSACPACSLRRFEYLNPQRKKLYTSICGRNAVQIVPEKTRKLVLSHLAENLGKAGSVELKPGVLYFRSGDAELAIFEDGRVIVRGTDDPVKAKSLFSKYVGD